MQATTKAGSQVEIERRYALVLHHAVKRMMEGLSLVLTQTLAQPHADDFVAEPIVRSSPVPLVPHSPAPSPSPCRLRWRVWSKP